MDATIHSTQQNDYTMSIYSWDGSDYTTKTEIATQTYTQSAGALPQFSYTAGAADVGKEIIFRYTHGPGGHNNYPQTSDVTFGITAVPEPSSLALLGMGGVALLLRRKKQSV